MKGLCKLALAILVVAACGRDGAITDPSERDALLRDREVLAIGVDSTTGASIETNKDDYEPGEVVHVVGRGWAPGETVNLSMTEDPNTHPDISTDVQADSVGEFSIHYYDVQEHDLGVKFTLTATGQTSRSVAIAVFTDSRFITAVELQNPVTLAFVLPPTQITVASGGTFNIRVTANTDDAGGGGGATPDDWQSTSWEIRGPSPGTSVAASGCDDGINIVDNATGAMHTFAATAPVGTGTYSVAVRAWRMDGCSANPSSEVTYASGLVVTTKTTVTALPTPSAFGQPVTFTAAVAPATTGTVTFYEFTGAQTCAALGGATALGPSDTSVPYTVATSALAAGLHTITACFDATVGTVNDSNGSVSHTVNRASTTTTLSSSPDPSTPGQTVAFTATVAAVAPGAGIPAGTVTLYEFIVAGENCTTPGGASPLGSEVLASGSVIINVSSLTTGAHIITACYGGSPNFEPSSGTDNHGVNLLATTTSVVSSINPSVTGQSSTFTATVVQGVNPVTTGTVTFRIGGIDCVTGTVFSGPTLLNGSGQATGNRSFLATETGSTIRACYSGGGAFDASNGTTTQTVDKANTSTTLSSSPDPSAAGQTVAFTAGVAASAPGAGTPTGTVTLYKFTVGQSCVTPGVAVALGSGALASGSVVINVSSLAVGVHTITACYLGDLNFNASSGTDLHEVALIGTTTDIVSSANPSVTGQNTTFTATVTRTVGGAAVTVGSVEFKTGGTTCATASPLAGPTAVNGAGQATHTQWFLATQTGTVVRACYAEGITYASSEDDVTQTVNKASTGTAATDSPDPTVFGEPVTLGATVTATAPGTGTPGGNVQFWNLTGGSCTAPVGTQLGATQPLSGGSASVNYSALAVGVHTITACYLGDANYLPSSNTTTHTVNKAQTVLVLETNTPTHFGNTATFTATISVVAPGAGSPSGTVRFYIGGTCDVSTGNGTGTHLGDDGTIVAGIAQFSTTTLNAGTHTIVACYGGDASFLGSTDSQSHLVNKATTSLGLASNNNPSEFGENVTFTATVTVTNGVATLTGLPVNFAVGGTCQPDGSITGAGQSLGSNNISAGGTAAVSISSLNALGVPYTIVACFGGNANIEGSGNTLSQTVNKAVTQTVASSTPDPSTFGQQVTFSATVSLVPNKGVGTPPGSVEFFLDGACGVGTSLGTNAVASGQASINVTSALLTAGAHTVYACFTSSSTNFTDSFDDDPHTVNAAPTTTVASIQTTSPQYSDKARLRAAVTPHTILGSELTGTVHFYFGASAVTCAASPPAGSVGTDAIAAADDGVGEIDYQVLSAAGNYVVTTCFYSSNPNFGNDGDDVGIVVSTEDATVAPGTPYGNSFPISGTTATFTLTFVVRETHPEPDANAGALPGDLSNAGLAVLLNAVGSGANDETGSCGSGVVAGTLYGQTKTFTCSFTTVAVDAYEVVATVNGAYYDGGYLDALTVYDPNGGFVTGGGKFVYPGSDERVNFGLVFKVNGNRGPRGNLLVMRHLANGDVCRGKSNDIDAPAVNGNTASFSGKGNYNCTRPDGTQYDGAGNQVITGWVEDNGQGSNATGPDRFWVRVNATNSKLLMPNTATANAAALTGGNLQVPQPGGPKP